MGARCLEVGEWGAYRNVLINLANVKDEDYARVVRDEAAYLHHRAKERCGAVLALVETRMAAPKA